MKRDKTRKSTLRRLIIAVICIVLAVGLLFLGIFVGEKLAFINFYRRAKKEFATPGVSSGFVGQGLDYLESENVFLSCGYSAKKGEASMVYLIDADGRAHKTELKNADGSNYTGHTGGIAHYREFVYITGGDGCDVFPLSDFVGRKGESRKAGSVKTFLDPAYCNVADGKFYTGSFYRSGNYETPEWQRMTTPCGDGNKAVITVFDIDDNAAENFYISTEPTAAYSTRGLVQGMTFTEDKIVLSASYGLASSHLYYYDKSGISRGQLTLNGENIPIYYLDSDCLTDTVTAPPMSEEIVYLNGRIYIMCESASNKYIFGKFTSGRHIYSYK